MHQQAQKGFCGIFVGIPEHQKVYLMYVPSTRKVISSYDIVFYKRFSSALSYTSQPYSEAMAMRPEVTYTPHATSSKDRGRTDKKLTSTLVISTFLSFELANIF